jgi:hypothetical protein
MTVGVKSRGDSIGNLFSVFGAAKPGGGTRARYGRRDALPLQGFFCLNAFSGFLSIAKYNF